MKFEYLVKHNGVYYQAGEEVPVEEEQNTPLVDVELPKTDENDAVDKTTVKSFELTKTAVNRLTVSELRQLAEEHGIDSSMSGAKLKIAIIEKFGL